MPPKKFVFSKEDATNTQLQHSDEQTTTQQKNFKLVLTTNIYKRKKGRLFAGLSSSEHSNLSVSGSHGLYTKFRGRPFDSWGGGLWFLCEKKIVQQIFENK